MTIRSDEDMGISVPKTNLPDSEEAKPLVDAIVNKPSITDYNETWLSEPKNLNALERRNYEGLKNSSQLKATGSIHNFETRKSSDEPKHIKYPHYFKDVSHLESIDVYRVLDLFNVTDPAIAHAVKKLLVTGKRGAKDQQTDLKEAIDSLQRKLEMLVEDNVI